MNREYPHVPRLAVGVLCLKHDRFLLIQRGQEPLIDQWTVPGGVVQLGESLHQAATREVFEECHIDIQIESLLDIYEYIEPDPDERVRFHYVIVEYLARYIKGDLIAGSDSKNAGWFSIQELEKLATTDATKSLVRKALHKKR